MFTSVRQKYKQTADPHKNPQQVSGGTLYVEHAFTVMKYRFINDKM
jgi:hypothetical protein